MDDARFEVASGELKLKTTEFLDFETANTVDVTVTSMDSDNLSVEKLFTLTVNDINEAPSAISLSTLTVNENATSAVIGTLATTDADTGDSHTYSVDDARFEVASGELKLKATEFLDFETANTVDVTVTSTDSDNLSVDKLFTLTVNDAPKIITGTEGVVDTFDYDIDSSQFIIESRQIDELIFKNFNPSEDKLVFNDLGTATTSTATIIDSLSIISNEDTLITFDKEVFNNEVMVVAEEGLSLTILGITNFDQITDFSVITV